MLRPQKQLVKDRRIIRDRRGQALVMFALAMTTICGLLALAVDVSLAYSIRKSAQSAADLAALAGAQQALSVIGPVGTMNYPAGSCPAAAGCQLTPTACPGNSQPSISTACQYASKNGFSNGSSNNGYTQTVKVAAFTNPTTVKTYLNCSATPVCTTTGLSGTNYWVYVEISEQIPHLFGGVLNNTFLTVDVNAVAAIALSGTGVNKKSTISLVQ